MSINTRQRPKGLRSFGLALLLLNEVRGLIVVLGAVHLWLSHLGN
jgi:hypothetical protein